MGIGGARPVETDSDPSTINAQLAGNLDGPEITSADQKDQRDELIRKREVLQKQSTLIRRRVGARSVL